MNAERIQHAIQEISSFAPFPDDDDEYIMTTNGAKQLDRYQELLSIVENEWIIPDNLTISSPMQNLIIPALLASFNISNGFGVFWGTLHFLEKFGDDLYPYVYRALQSSHNVGTRCWSCHLLGRRRNRNDVVYVINALADQHPVVRQEALLAIVMLAQTQHIPEAIDPVSRLINDPIEDVRYDAQDTLEALQNI